MSTGNHIGGSALHPQGGYERERADDLDPHHLRDFDDETESKSESDSPDPRRDSTNTNPNADEPDDTDIFADDTPGNIIADTSNENTPDEGIAEVKTGDNTFESPNAPETLAELARDIYEDKVEAFLTGNGNLRENFVNVLLDSIKYQLKQASLTDVTSEEGDQLFREHMVERFQSEDLERIEFPKPDEDMPKSVQEERQKDLSQEYESIEADLSGHAADDDRGFNCIHFSIEFCRLLR